ncbi:unnamed protein product [Timema podura]|uniref:Uncharacterized protein n=1 Tax=Timema podura TaxID=61482 RepID=A0ABN7P4Q0_TIMPD|nr:unnamed protein product [Timema podura]
MYTLLQSQLNLIHLVLISELLRVDLLKPPTREMNSRSSTSKLGCECFLYASVDPVTSSQFVEPSTI